jgi:hypothetical protein
MAIWVQLPLAAPAAAAGSASSSSSSSQDAAFDCWCKLSSFCEHSTLLGEGVCSHVRSHEPAHVGA